MILEILNTFLDFLFKFFVNDISNIKNPKEQKDEFFVVWLIIEKYIENFVEFYVKTIDIIDTIRICLIISFLQ